MASEESLRTGIQVRLGELRRTVAELEALLDSVDADEGELEAGLELSGELGRVDPDARRLPFRRGPRGNRPGRDGRAPYGTNRQRILEEIVTVPGISAPEIAERTGINPRVVSATVYRLKRRGELECCGEGVRVAAAA